MNKLINGYSYIEVPQGFFGYSIIQGDKETIVKISDRGGDYNTVIIPKGDYEIIGKKLSEDEWKAVVNNMGERYMRYSPEGSMEVASLGHKYPFYTATESGLSLLKSLNLLDKYERGELLILKEKK